MRARLRAVAPADCPIVALLDGRLLAWGALWGIASLGPSSAMTMHAPIQPLGRGGGHG